MSDHREGFQKWENIEEEFTMQKKIRWKGTMLPGEQNVSTQPSSSTEKELLKTHGRKWPEMNTTQILNPTRQGWSSPHTGKDS
jgi:hypothetical protein